MLPVIDLLALSQTVMVWVPFFFKVTPLVKVCTPLFVVVKV